MLDKILGKKTKFSFKKEQPIDIVGTSFLKLKSDYTSFVFDVIYPGIFLLDESEIKAQLIEPIRRACKDLPKGTNMTFTYNSKPDRADFDFNKEEQNFDYLNTTLIKKFGEVYSTNVKTYLVVSFPRSYNPDKFLLPDDEASIRNKVRRGTKVAPENLNDYIPYLNVLVKAFNQVCTIKWLNERPKLIRYAEEYINFRHFDPTNRVESFVDNDNYILAGKKLFSIFSLKNNPDGNLYEFSYPSYVNDPKEGGHQSLNMAASFLHQFGMGLNIPHITTLSFTVHDNKEFGKALDKGPIDSTGTVAKIFDDNQLKNNALKGFKKVVEDSTDNRFVTYSFNVTVIADDREELKTNEELTEDVFRVLNWKYVREDYITLKTFLANFAGNGYEQPRTLLGSLSHALCLFPFESPGMFSTVGIPVATKSNKLTFLDLFNLNAWFGNKKTIRANYNMLLSGKSGAGKSNLISMIAIYVTMLMKGRMLILDKGNSFNRITNVLGGKKWEYLPEKPLSFNPFLLDLNENGKVEYTRDSLEMLTPVILSAVENTFDDRTISTIQDVLINHLFKAYFQSYNSGKVKKLKFDTFFVFVTDFYEDIKGDDTNPVNSRLLSSFPWDMFITSIEKFRTGNIYGELMNAEENFNLIDYPLNVFELDKIQNDEFLFRIVSINIVLLQEKLLKDPRLDGVFKFSIIDEATFILKSWMADVIVGNFQTARKHYGGIMISDQTYDSLIKAGKDIVNRTLQNTDTVVWLKQKDVAENWKLIRETFGYSESKMNRIKAMDIQQGHREAVMQVGDNDFYSFKMYQSREMYLAFNTDSNYDQVRVNKKLDEYLKLVNNEKVAIEQIKEDINEGTI